MQSKGFWIQSELENPGSWSTIQSSNKNMQTLCAGTVLHSEKTPPRLPKPQAGDRHHLSTHQNVSPQKCGESESPRLKTWSRFAFNLYQYQFVSPDDWVSCPWNRLVEKIKIEVIAILYIIYIEHAGMVSLGPPPTWFLAGSSAFGLSETFLVSVRLGLIGFWPKRDFLLLLGGLIGGSA